MKSTIKLLVIILSAIIIILIALFILFGSGRCVDPDPGETRQIKLINNSKEMVYWILSNNNDLNESTGYLDSDSIMPDSCDTIACCDLTWDALSRRSANKKINIYILNTDGMPEDSLNHVSGKQSIKKKISVDIDYLNKNNWTITYK